MSNEGRLLDFSLVLYKLIKSKIFMSSQERRAYYPFYSSDH